MRKPFFSLALSSLTILLTASSFGQQGKSNISDRQAAEAVFQKVHSVLLNWNSGLTVSQLEEFRANVGNQLIVKVIYPRWAKQRGRVDFHQTETHQLTKAQTNKIIDEKIAQIKRQKIGTIDRHRYSKLSGDFENWVSMDYAPFSGKIVRVSVGEWRWDKSGACQPGHLDPSGYNILRLKKENGTWKLSFLQIPKITFLGD